MKFSLFRKEKEQSELEKQEVTYASEETKQEVAAPQGSVPAGSAPAQEIVASTMEKKQEVAEPLSKTYLKAMPLKDVSDVENVKNEVKNGNIIILRVTPLANKSVDDVKTAVNELYQFAESIGGDIARLGEERVVICPKNIRIWREKTPASNEPLPTAA
jgi:hypothetical protein